MPKHIHIDGPTGSGKTTVARALYAQAAKEGQKVLYVFPEGVDHAHARALSSMLGVPDYTIARAGGTVSPLIINSHDVVLWDGFFPVGMIPTYRILCSRPARAVIQSVPSPEKQ